MVKYPDFTDASCAGLDLNIFFFQDDEQLSRKMRRAVLPTVKRMCNACPVQEDCLTWALHHEEHGIWAGTTEKERHRMRIKSNIKYKNLSNRITSYMDKYGRPSNAKG